MRDVARRLVGVPAIVVASLLVAVSIFVVGMFLLICLFALFAWLLGEPL